MDLVEAFPGPTMTGYLIPFSYPWHRVPDECVGPQARRSTTLLQDYQQSMQRRSFYLNMTTKPAAVAEHDLDRVGGRCGPINGIGERHIRLGRSNMHSGERGRRRRNRQSRVLLLKTRCQFVLPSMHNARRQPRYPGKTFKRHAGAQCRKDDLLLLLRRPATTGPGVGQQLARQRLIRIADREGTKVCFSPFSRLDCMPIRNRCRGLRTAHNPCAPCSEGSRRQSMPLAIVLLGRPIGLKCFHMSNPKLLPIIHHVQIRRCYSRSSTGR